MREREFRPLRDRRRIPVAAQPRKQALTYRSTIDRATSSRAAVFLPEFDREQNQPVGRHS